MEQEKIGTNTEILLILNMMNKYSKDGSTLQSNF